MSYKKIVKLSPEKEVTKPVLATADTPLATPSIEAISAEKKAKEDKLAKPMKK